MEHRNKKKKNSYFLSQTNVIFTTKLDKGDTKKKTRKTVSLMKIDSGILTKILANKTLQQCVKETCLDDQIKFIHGTK